MMVISFFLYINTDVTSSSPARVCCQPLLKEDYQMSLRDLYIHIQYTALCHVLHMCQQACCYGNLLTGVYCCIWEDGNDQNRIRNTSRIRDRCSGIQRYQILHLLYMYMQLI